MVEKMEPIEKLWKTAYKFDKCHEIWYGNSASNHLFPLEKKHRCGYGATLLFDCLVQTTEFLILQNSNEIQSSVKY